MSGAGTGDLEQTWYQTGANHWSLFQMSVQYRKYKDNIFETKFHLTQKLIQLSIKGEYKKK